MTEHSHIRPPDQVPPSAAVDIGVARREITPPVGIYNRQWGAATHDVAEGVHRPFYVTVMVMRESDGDPPLVLAAVDAGWWQLAEDEWRIRGPLIESLGLDPARVMVCVSHTHSGASLCTEDVDKPGGHMISPYLERMADAVQAAARQAMQKMRPATLTWATGRCDLAANRDLPDPDAARIVCGFNPEGAADDTLLVGRATDASGRVLTTIVNYACHPTTLAWENRLLSPDYVGAMREMVENHTNGAPCLFLQGASGDLGPRDGFTGETAIADANGRRLGFAVLATLESMLPSRTLLTYSGIVESGAPLANWARCSFEPCSMLEAERIEVEVPLKSMPSATELRSNLEVCKDRILAERLRRALRVRTKIGDGTSLRTPVWIWRVGQAVFVGHNNEAFSAFQVALRESFPDHAVVVINLANGSIGYIPTPELYDNDMYQVWQTPFDRETLPRLIDACRRRIDSMVASH